jgi:malate dehydrogenase (oxaloacetate-decarboxylating)(NADP+)
VAQAAEQSGVAREPIADLESYREWLHVLVERSRGLLTPLIRRARSHAPRRIVFPSGSHPSVLRAAQILRDEQICAPVLLGHEWKIQKRAAENRIDLTGIETIEPTTSEHFEMLAEALWQARQRKGVTRNAARAMVTDPIYFAALLVKHGLADGMVGGPGRPYKHTLKPALRVLGANGSAVSGVYAMLFKDRKIFFGDCTVNVDPDASALADIALNTARVAETFGQKPRVAMLSYSDFGEHRTDARVDKVRDAVALVRERRPDLEIDGEMQADTAVDFDKISQAFPFSELEGPANVLIFPDLTSGNIAYKLLAHLSAAEALGPLLVGLNHPVNVIPVEGGVTEIVNVATYTANQALDRAGATAAPE